MQHPRTYYSHFTINHYHIHLSDQDKPQKPDEGWFTGLMILGISLILAGLLG